ncbi:MAG: hypothetical protein WAN50_01040 [Minisyncoccia bacterium]
MDTTSVLAEVLGIIFTVAGLSLLINRKSASGLLDELSRSHGLLWFGGFIALLFGSVLVAVHNSWNSELESLVSIIGWLALLKGAWILVLPDSSVSLYKKSNTAGVIAFSGFIALLLGLILLYEAVIV